MKKQFWIGLLTGLIVTLFVGSAALGIKELFFSESKNEKEAVKESVDKKTEEKTSKKEKQKKEEKDEKKENKKESDSSSKKDSENGNDGYVLSDEATVDKMMEIEDLIDKLYVDDVDNDTLKEGIFEGMMDALGDPYAAYYSQEDYQALMNDTQGIYYGIGAYLQKDVDTKYPRITGIIANSPAEESSLCVDDYIVEVDGVDVYDMDLSEAVLLIKGPENTDVTLTIVRKSTGDQFEETLTRREVVSPSVTYEMHDNNIAYIQISEFDIATVQQFSDYLDEARADKMKALIIDLRGNPGGSLSACVDIARLLLPKGLVVYTEDKYGKRVEYNCDGKHELEVPLVVLVDGNSASAAEILSGAIKDYGIGTIMGTTTFGKGIVQRIVDLEDGSAVKMTVSHYYTPKGNDIHKIGVEPDIEVIFDAEAYRENKDNDNQLKAAEEYLLNEIK